MNATKRKFGQITFAETLGLFVVVLILPFVQASRLIWRPFVPYDRARTWRRVKADAGAGYATSRLNAHQIQFVDGTTENVYRKWAAGAGVTVDNERIEEGAQLLWVTPRKRKRVILYFHGGGFVLSVPPFALSFWKNVVDNLKGRGEDFSLAVLEYTLIPTAEFPTPLRQSIAAIQHLLNAGYAAEDICLVGDSAGANLILQVLAHTLHPVPGVTAALPLSTTFKIGPIILISPWVTLHGTSASFASNSDKDIFQRVFYDHVGSFVSPSALDSLRIYVEPSRAQKDWFVGVGEFVSSVLITVGNSECLRDDIDKFSEAFSAAHDQTEVKKIPGGTHNEPYGAFAAGEPEPGKWPILIVDWIIGR